MGPGWWGNSAHLQNGSSVSGSKVIASALAILPPARRDKNEEGHAQSF